MTSKIAFCVLSPALPEKETNRKRVKECRNTRQSVTKRDRILHKLARRRRFIAPVGMASLRPVTFPIWYQYMYFFLLFLTTIICEYGPGAHATDRVLMRWGRENGFGSLGNQRSLIPWPWLRQEAILSSLWKTLNAVVHSLSCCATSRHNPPTLHTAPPLSMSWACRGEIHCADGMRMVLGHRSWSSTYSPPPNTELLNSIREVKLNLSGQYWCS
ncbi:hypothetical protein CBL_01858 [Carabus blaptoides fortunei]